MSRMGGLEYLNPVDVGAMTSRVPSPRGSRVSAGGLDERPPRTHLQSLRLRMMAVDLLRLAKERMTYRELSRILGLQATVISRYVKGHVLPGLDRARMIWRTLNPVCGLQAHLLSRIRMDDGVAIDVSGLVGDPWVLNLAASDCLNRYAGYRVTRILTTAVNGVPLASAVAQALEAPMVVAKRHMDVGVEEFLETVYGVNGENLELLYLPKGSLRSRDSVLLVDDVVRTGRTIRALLRLVRKARAEPAGVYCLIGFRDTVQRLREQGLRVETALEVMGP